MRYFIPAIVALLISFSHASNIYTQDKNSTKRENKAIKGEYKSVMLGMTREEALSIIEKDPELEIDIESDYGDFDEEQKYLLKAKRHPFIRQIYYQFTKNKDRWILYAIIIHFNPRYNDYLKLYKVLSAKYGKSTLMTNTYAFWSAYNRDKYKSYDGRNIGVKLVINRPASLKIIDESLYKKESTKQRRSKIEEIKAYQKQMSKRLLKDFIE